MAKSKKEPEFKYLVIVESPAKSKTLTKILGKDFLVKSSVGHIRDLPAKGLGIDVKNNFEPSYEIMSGKTKVVDELNQFAKKAEHVYLASDPDREGEAIAWHLSQILKAKKKNLSRIAFNQITPDAVRSAVESPREINKSLVDAQQARRILDRLVGYKISPLLWRKVGGRSAGRVQSIAVRLICEREEEIEAFVPEEYWSLAADVNADNKDPIFEINLTHVDSKRVVTPVKEYDPEKAMVISSEAEMNKIIDRVKAAELNVSKISTKPSSKKAQAPFKTSTLQRAASNALGFNVKRTMQVAQGLYEGVKIDGNEQVGLITYMRTDSLRIAPEAQEAAKEYISNKWGADYYPETANEYSKSKKKKNEQDAHEAIRPTYIDKDPESIKKYLSDEQYKLYKLIWQRFVASQMVPMKLEIKTVEISSKPGDLVFRASHTKKIFAGYSAVYGKDKEIGEEIEAAQEESNFSDSLKEGTSINVLETKPGQHFTEGPPRYNEASLVKALEELGIGRPSTYAPTIATIQDRKYVEKVEGSTGLKPTRLGIQVNKLLVDHFGQYINVDFTSHMESDLDDIAEKGLDWIVMLKEFYLGKDWKKKEKIKPRRKTKKNLEDKTPDPYYQLDLGFIDNVKKASEEIENVVIETEYDCPTCGAMMHLKSSRFGPFLGCSKYPDCQTIVNLTKEGTPAPPDRPYSEEDCNKCEEKESLVVRYGRYGDYLACVTKDCGFTSPIQKKTGISCPREGCGGDIVEKKSRFGKVFFGCNKWSENGCEEVFWYHPIQENCPDCKKLMMYKTLKRGDKLACSDTKGCGYNRLASPKDIEKYRPQVQETEGEKEKSVFSL
ncbi:MAG: type I DNA topoisomerase [Candidatus Melainabacteria bacterium]|nr:type I DNA topoisomerase [Candidatus Melainabacteria bacterium]